MKCTYCGGTRFYEGPSGGMSVNILCANPECRHWFNDIGTGELKDLNRVEPSDEEKQIKRDADKKEQEEYPRRCYEEGFSAYNKGIRAVDILQSSAHWHQVTGADLYRLAGLIDASRGKTYEM